MLAVVYWHSRLAVQWQNNWHARIRLRGGQYEARRARWKVRCPIQTHSSPKRVVEYSGEGRSASVRNGRRVKGVNRMMERMRTVHGVRHVQCPTRSVVACVSMCCAVDS